MRRIVYFFNTIPHIAISFIALAVVVALVIPFLISDGMFMDGQQYACVAKNLAEGHGSFWYLRFTEIGVGGFPTFHEQPPLMFGMQALFFKCFGAGFFTERLYGLLMLVITILLITEIFRFFVRKNIFPKNMGFLPVLMWVLVPVVHWTYANNLVEVTMGVFICMSFLFLIKALWSDRKKYMWFSFAAIAIFLASFTKGLPGVFTLSVPFWYWLIYRRNKLLKTIWQTLFLLFVIAFCYGLLLLIPEARSSLYIHWVYRAFGRIKSDPVVAHRTMLLLSLISELAVVYIPVILGVIWVRIKHADIVSKENVKVSLFLFFTALSGSLPLMLTLVQRNFYYVGAIPFFALAASAITAPLLNMWLNKLQKNWIRRLNYLSLVVLCIAIGFSITFYHKPLRDKDILSDVYTIGDIVGENCKLFSSGDIIFNHWSFRSYLLRYYNIELVNYSPVDYYVFCSDRKVDTNYYVPIDCSLNNYTLYKAKSVTSVPDISDK
jgi:4-amino-4-deoxy-L-arabinose transferase-like glycosyltransferase